ncbi:MAG: class I SAM-dependent methyltransferase [Bryobacteraceae bacterium]|jgi:SAM-dependent methyltransferase
MTNQEYLGNLLAPYGPALPLETLAEELNKIYHSFEAPSYDARHPEIHQQLPPLWAEMIGLARQWRPGGRFRILDFGCGTGFEAQQVMLNLGPESIASLTCYDPSSEMLDRCRQALASARVPIRFVRTTEQLMGLDTTYNLVVTNSLLHHLPRPAALLSDLHSIIEPHAIWLAGHEPSARFFRNAECYEVFRDYNQRVSKRKLFSPGAYLRRARMTMGLDANPAASTATVSQRNGLFQRKPPRSVIGRVVDYHVPHSPDEARDGRGFDFQQLAMVLDSIWRLEWVKSYAFLGQYLETALTPEWQARARSLAAKYPLDGASFCSAWRRA